jgi:hypothetical protein
MLLLDDSVIASEIVSDFFDIETREAANFPDQRTGRCPALVFTVWVKVDDLRQSANASLSSLVSELLTERGIKLDH